MSKLERAHHGFIKLSEMQLRRIRLMWHAQNHLLNLELDLVLNIAPKPERLRTL